MTALQERYDQTPTRRWIRRRVISDLMDRARADEVLFTGGAEYVRVYGPENIKYSVA
jgi:hypothetical protein